MRAFITRFGALRLALIASLALNLALAGIVAGGAFHDHGGRKGFAPPLLRALPEAARESLRKDFFRHDRDEGRDRRRDAWRRDLASAARAEPFDRAAAEAALARERDGNDKAVRRVHAALLDALAAMPLDQRRDYARRLASRHRR